MAKERIFITGEHGMLASAMIERLKKDYDVINIWDEMQKYKTHSAYNFFEIFYSKHISLLKKHFKPEVFENKMEFDILNTFLLDTVFRSSNPDIVVHAAAIVNTDRCEMNVTNAVLTNIIGTQNIVRLVEQYEVPYFVNFSTSAIYDPDAYHGGIINEKTSIKPQTIYPQTKLFAELLALEANTKVLNLRPVFVYGDFPIDKSSMITKILVNEIINRKHILERTQDVLLNPLFKKDYMRVEDFADAFAALIEYKCSGTYNVAAGKSMLFCDLLETLKRELGVDALHINLFPDKDYLRGHVVDNRKLRNATNWNYKIREKEGVHMTHESILKEMK